MKSDRLMAITIYLMNRETVSASALAKRFEVSRRTIQRDMETLCQAGLPIVSTMGSDGGYQVMDGFRLTKQIAGNGDYRNIVTALKGLGTAYGGKEVEETLQKVLMSMPYDRQRLFMDFSAASEHPLVEEHLQTMEPAISGKVPLRFPYADAQGHVSVRTVEPLALCLKWYHWYLFAYCRTRRAYRMFKLQRIERCETVRGSFSKNHGDVEALMEQHDRKDGREQLQIRLRCKGGAHRQVLEYLRGEAVGEYENGDVELLLPERPLERMWFSLLLGFGNQVEVLEPASLRQMLLDRAKEITNLYGCTTD